MPDRASDTRWISARRTSRSPRLRCLSTGELLLDLVPAQLVMQGPRADPEDLGGFFAVRRDVCEHLSDHLLLDGAEWQAQGNGDASLWWGAGHERGRHVHGTDGASLHGDDEPLHEIAELPNIARPCVLAEDLEDGGRERFLGAPVLGAELVKKYAGEQ